MPTIEKTTDKTVEKAKELRDLIFKARDLMHGAKREELGFMAEDILVSQTEFLTYKINSETSYRQRIRQLEEEKDLSFSSAENLAKTEEVYAIYKKTDHLYDLASEQIRLLKILLTFGY